MKGSSVILFLSALCLGCASREHMSEHQGEQTRRFFALQRVNQRAAQGSPGGLDSEESALIQATYKDTLGHERNARSDGASRVMLLQESKDDQGAQ